MKDLKNYDSKKFILFQLKNIEPKKPSKDGVFICCPFHNDHEPSCHISFGKKVAPGLFYCFGCRATGHWNLIAQKLGLDRLPLSYPSPSYRVNEVPRNLSPNLSYEVIKQYKIKKLVDEEPYYSYAKRRYATNFDNALFISEKEPGYLIIGLPLLNKEKDYFFGRKLMLAGPRYKYLSGPITSKIAKSFKGSVKEAVIVEGIFDLTSVARVFPTIALLGKSWNDIKISKVLKFIKEKAYIMLDADALTETYKLAILLSKHIKVEIIDLNLTNYTDPGEVSLKWLTMKLQS